MFAALDLATGEMFYRYRYRNRAGELGDFCRPSVKRSLGVH
jgi:hypothetical protein